MKHFALLLPSLCLLVPFAGAQWSTPAVMGNVNSPYGEFGPSVSVDGLTLYFASDRPGVGGYDLYRATRATPYVPFGAPSLIPELCTANHEGQPCVRTDELEIFFFSNRVGGTGGYDLWRAERTSTSVPFNRPLPVVELNTTANDLSPSLSGDGLRIWFDSGRTGGLGGADVLTAIRPSLGAPFGAPAPVAELNTASDDRDPHVSPDGLVMFFASNRAGGRGFHDIWMASRLDPASPFGNIVNVSALNSTLSDQEPAFPLFPDEIFFSSLRSNSSWDLLTARFTGISGAGIAGVASARDLRLSDPSSPGRVYLAASSLASTPGIPIDTRVLPLKLDLLFQLSIGGLAPALTGYVGVLDQQGVGAARIAFTGFPELKGLRFSTAFVVFVPTAPSGVRTISNAHEVLVQ